jgi:hypothetical protein
MSNVEAESGVSQNSNIEGPRIPHVVSGEALWVGATEGNVVVATHQQNASRYSPAADNSNKQAMLDCCREEQPLNRFKPGQDTNKQMFQRKGSMDRLPHFEHSDEYARKGSVDQMPPAQE